MPEMRDRYRGRRGLQGRPPGQRPPEAEALGAATHDLQDSMAALMETYNHRDTYEQMGTAPSAESGRGLAARQPSEVAFCYPARDLTFAAGPDGHPDAGEDGVPPGLA